MVSGGGKQSQIHSMLASAGGGSSAGIINIHQSQIINNVTPGQSMATQRPVEVFREGVDVSSIIDLLAVRDIDDLESGLIQVLLTYFDVVRIQSSSTVLIASFTAT